MRKLFFFVFAIIIFSSEIATAQILKSNSYIERTGEFKTNQFQTEIVITDKTITIKKFNNGHKSDQVMKIDRIENKDYDFSPCVWYYCTDAEKDMGVYRKDICIYDKPGHCFYYANFEQEINVFWYKFNL